MEGKQFPIPTKRHCAAPPLSKLETNAEDSRRATESSATPTMAELEPHASASSPSAAGADASPAPNPVASAGARKRKAAAAAARKPRKQQAEEPIQIAVYYGHTKDFYLIQGDDLVDCSYISPREKDCARLVGELPLQPQSMSLVDLQLWIFKLFRLHPETQDLVVQGFLKQRTTDMSDDFEPEWYMEYYPWENRYFYTDKHWRAFANKLKRRRNVTQRCMLYVQSSETKHYAVMLKAVHEDDYSQLARVVLLGTKCLTDFKFRFHRLVEDLAFTPKDIIAYLAKHYGEQVNPPGAWRARQKALEMEFGTFYDSHNFAPRLLTDLARKNPRVFVDIKDAEVPGCNGFRVLHRIFWVFDPCSQAFCHCRPVLCIKGMPLCGKYQGVLLTAVALDANDCSIPVACAVVEGETKESWMWFLRNLEQAFRHHPSDVCIIHDSKSEIIEAMEDFLNNPSRRQWPKAEGRWCMEHLADNFFAYFGDNKLVMMFKKLCQQRRVNKFVKIWKELDELTTKYTADKELAAQSPCNQPNSVEYEEEGEHADDSNRKITRFSDWIHMKPMEKWSLAHDRKGARYGIMGTDIADVYKNDPVLKGITCLPLSGIVEVTFQRLAVCFKNTSAAANQAIGNPSLNFPERVQDDMNSKMQKSKMHCVIRIDTSTKKNFQGKVVRKFKVESGQKTEIVYLNSEDTHSTNKFENSTVQSATCSCNGPQLLHKPCCHVIAVCCQIGVNTATYMSPYYSQTYLGRTWGGKFEESMISRNYRGRAIMPFDDKTTTWIPDKRLECGLPFFLTSDCLEAVAEEAEQQCSTGNGSFEDNQVTTTRAEEPNRI